MLMKIVQNHKRNTSKNTNVKQTYETYSKTRIINTDYIVTIDSCNPDKYDGNNISIRIQGCSYMVYSNLTLDDFLTKMELDETKIGKLLWNLNYYLYY